MSVGLSGHVAHSAGASGVGRHSRRLLAVTAAGQRCHGSHDSSQSRGKPEAPHALTVLSDGSITTEPINRFSSGDVSPSVPVPPYDVLPPHDQPEHYRHAWWPAGASHLSCDISPVLGALQMHGNYAIHGPAIVQRSPDETCLLVRLLPGGWAEQATSYVPEPSGRCHQDVVASVEHGSGSYSSDSDLEGMALLESELEFAGEVGEVVPTLVNGTHTCNVLLLYGAHVQLAGSFSFSTDVHAERAVREHAGDIVLSVGSMGHAGTIWLSPGSELTHPVNVHPANDRR